MNKIILMGRLTRDPEANYSKSGKAFTKIAVAVERPHTVNGEKKTDFFDCTAFGKTAEVIGNYFTKGQQILLDGSVQFNEYTDKNGVKKRSTNVIIERIEFVAAKKKAAENSNFGEAFGYEEEIDF